LTEPIQLKRIEMDGLMPAGPQDFGELAEALLRSPPAEGEMPRVFCNFISTLDGRATIGGSTERLGFHADARVVMRLRTFADAVLIGAGTMRVERYDRMVPVPRLREYREQIGLPADPLTVIVTTGMDLPWDAGLFSEGHGKVLLATSSSLKPPATATELETIRYEGEVDLRALLAHLRRERGIETLVCEGGPTVLGALLRLGLVDDLFLTHNPVLVGDGERGLLRGRLPEPVGAELTWVLAAEGELFSRWRLDGPGGEPAAIK
jgi:riboflavin biosynthesis pyrimidine reductase